MQQSFPFAVSPVWPLARVADMRRGTLDIIPALFSIFDDGEPEADTVEDATKPNTPASLRLMAA